MIFHCLRGPFSFFCISVDVFCLDHSADHQKLNIIQKWTFYFLITKGAFFVFLHFSRHILLGLLGQSSEVECNPKTNILFFNDLGGLFWFFLCFGQHFWLGSLGRSSEVERNPKMNISFFNDLGGLFHFFGFWLTVFCSDHSTNHQKLNIIQKHFIFQWLKGPFLVFCVLVNVFSSDRLADHQKLNVIEKWTFYFSMT